MATFTNVKITNIKGTSGAASSTGTITSATGDEEYISRWMPGKPNPHITGTLTIASGDIGSGWRHRPLIEINEWDNWTGGWGNGKRYFTSNYRTTAGAMTFDFTLPTAELAPGTKYRVTVYVTKNAPSITSPYQPITTYGPKLRTSFWTNRTPDSPVITSPPTGVSFPYNDGVNSEFPITWTAADVDAVPNDADYYGYEVQYRATPTPTQPSPTWANWTFDMYSPRVSHASWALKDGSAWSDYFGFPNFGGTGTNAANTNTILVHAKPTYPIGVTTNRVLMLLGPGTWEFRLRTFDYSGSPQTSPGSIPAYGTSEWSNTITVNITAPFLPPLPLDPINDEAVVLDSVNFEWLFRDPRTAGGEQMSARVRIRRDGDPESAWTEIRTVPTNNALRSYASGVNPDGLAAGTAGSTYILDETTSRIRKYDSSGAETGSWLVGGTNPGPLAVDGSGNMYVLDYDTNIIRKLNSAGTQTTSWSGGTGGITNIVVDAAGNSYVADSFSAGVRKFTAAGVANGILTIPNISGLALGPGNVIYTSDSVTNVIRTYSSSGVAGISFPTVRDDPDHLAVDSTGFVYVTYSLSPFDQIDKYSPTGELVSTYVLASGTAGRVVIDSTGKLHVTTGTNGARVFEGTQSKGLDTVSSYLWINGDRFTLEPGLRYEWQARTVSFPGDFDSGWSGPTGFFWAIPAADSGPVIPGADDTLPDPGLGCGVNRAFLFARGGERRLGEITETEMIRWGRTRDGISTCSIKVTGWSGDCGELLKSMRSWMNEIVIYRDNGNGQKRVWEGPITRITYSHDSVEIEAQDVWVYVYRRILRQGFNDAYRRVGWKYGPGGVVLVKGQEYGLTPVTRRSAQIVRNALAYDDPNVLAYLTIIEKADDARQSRVVPDYSTTAWQQIDDFAAKSGLDYTAIGRKMVLWDTHNPIGVLPEMRDNDFGTPPVVTEYGMQLANFYGVTNNSGVYGTAERLTNGEPQYYGWIEMLSSAYGESDESGETITLTAAAKAALEEALAEQAERSIASRWPTPLVVRVPDNTTLNPEINIGINDLVPGVFIPVRASGTLREVTQMQKLDSMSVTQTQAGEVVTVTLSPAPRSRSENPDEEGIEE